MNQRLGISWQIKILQKFLVEAKNRHQDLTFVENLNTVARVLKAKKTESASSSAQQSANNYPETTENFTYKLEMLANYCFLRNQQTYGAFTLWKKQLYFLLGLFLGVFWAYLLNIAKLVWPDDGNTAAALLSLPIHFGGNEINFASAMFQQGNDIPFTPPNLYYNAFLGAGAGIGASPTHAVVNYFNNLEPSAPRPTDYAPESVGP